MGFIRSKHYGMDRVLEHFGAESTVNPDAREIIEGELRCSYVFRNRCRISIKDKTHVREAFFSVVVQCMLVASPLLTLLK